MHRFQIVLLTFLLVLPPATALAEEQAPAGQLFMIHQEIVKPSKVLEYEEVSREFVQLLRQQKVESRHVRFSTFASDEMVYVYVTPIASFGAIDELQKDWGTLVEQIGFEKWSFVMERSSRLLEHTRTMIARLRPELSHRPESPRVKPEEAGFMHYGYYYGLPGRQQEIEQVARDYAELYRSKKIADGFSVYEVVVGDELPLYIVAQAGKSAGDYFSRAEELERSLGEESTRLRMRAMALTRRLESKNGRLRPDLSYEPATAQE